MIWPRVMFTTAELRTTKTEPKDMEKKLAAKDA